MVVNHNLSAMFASRKTDINGVDLQKVMEKLSSGERINRAGDDASGLSVSEKMRAQIRGLNQASKNVANGVNFVQTTEGYLEETTSILQRIRELAVQSANGIYSDEDRMQIQVEVSQLVSEVDRIASTAQFNGMNLLSGRFAENGITFQVGANMDQQINVKIGDMSAQSLGLRSEQSAITVEDAENSNRVIGTIDEALKAVNRQRGDLGAVQNRLELTQKGIDVAAENIQATESTIRDTDFAKEMVNLSKEQILNETSVAMLAQSNSQAQNVLSLLK